MRTLLDEFVRKKGEGGSLLTVKNTVKTTKIRITVVYPDKAASFIDRDTKHSVRRGGCRARKRIIYGNF